MKEVKSERFQEFWVLFMEKPRKGCRYFQGIKHDIVTDGPSWCGGTDDPLAAMRFKSKSEALKYRHRYNHRWGTYSVEKAGYSQAARVSYTALLLVVPV